MKKQPEFIFLGEPDMALDPTEEAAVLRLLGEAALAVCAPRQSGFAVQAAAMNTAGDVVRGGNREYALSGSYVHAESAVVSEILSEYPDVPLLGIGIYGEHEGDNYPMPCPCGNCRDILREEATPNLLVAAGDQEAAVVMRLAAFLCTTFRHDRVENALANPVLAEGFVVALQARARGVTEYLPPALRAKPYGVVLIDERHRMFPGSLDTNAGYDAISPGVAAVQSFRNRSSGADTTVAKLQSIVIVGGRYGVDPLYRDRDAITVLDELLQAGEDFTPTPVYLFAADGSVPMSLYRTDTTEWLPYPFTDGAIGPKVASQKLQKLRKYM